MINDKTRGFSPETYALLRKKQTAEIDAWLDEHVAQETGYVLDDSLTLENAAAQAKATGDAIAANAANLAPAFDSTATYAVGDLVLYDGAVYRFKAAHTGAWSSSDAEHTTLGAEMEDVNAALAPLVAAGLSVVDGKLCITYKRTIHV